MTSINAMALTRPPIQFEELTHVADYIYFDGPLLCLYKKRKGGICFLYWCDSDDQFNRWIVLELDELDRLRYCDKDITLRHLVEKQKPACVVLDILSDMSIKTAWLLPSENMPADYLPDKDSYYNFHPVNINPHFERIRSIKLGSEWDFQGLQTFQRTLKKGYAIAHQLLTATANNSVDIFRRSALKCGFDYAGFYNSLESDIPHTNQMGMVSLKISSPGWMEIEVKPEIFDNLKRIMDVVYGNKERIRTAEEEARTHLRKAGLLGANGREANREITDPEEALFKMQVIQLITVTGLPELQRFLENAPNSAVSLKVILSAIRQLRKLVGFEENGMATLA